MWELDCEESWALKNWCFWTVVLEKSLESLLDCKEIQPVHPEGDQSWMFIGRTDAEAETPMLWPPHVKSWLIGKDPDAGGGLGAGGEGDDRRWDGWMALPTLWTWVWVNSGSWWWTRRPGVLWFMGLQRVGNDWDSELNWTELSLQVREVFFFFFHSFLIPWIFISNSIFCQPFMCLSWCLWNHFAIHTPLLFFTCLLCRWPESILICTAIKRMNHHLFSNAYYLKFYFHP